MSNRSNDDNASRRPEDEAVQEAAEHADAAIEHRREATRDAVRADADDGARRDALEQESGRHGRAADREQARAAQRARDADG